MIPQVASLSKQFLLLDVINQISIKKDRQRRSSKGIVEFNFNPNDTSIALDEGRCKIEGIAVLGSCFPTVRDSKSVSTVDELYKSSVASHSERITIALPVELNLESLNSDSSANGVNTNSKENALSCSWALPLSASIDHNFDNEGEKIFSIIFERLLCSHISGQLTGDVKNKLFRRAMLGTEDSKNGPKSIAQVRKEREKNNAIAQGIEFSSLVDIDLTSTVTAAKHNVSKTIDDENLTLIKRSLTKSSSLITCVGLPTNLDDFVYIQNRRRKVAVMIVWKCRWQGVVRTGLHFVRNISPYTIPTSKPSIISQHLLHEPTKQSLENLLVRLVHPSEACLISLESNKGNEKLSVSVPVMMELCNSNSTRLFVTVEAVIVNTERQLSIKNKDDNTLNASLVSTYLTPPPPIVPSNTPVTGLRETISRDENVQQVKKGFFWEGKSKYVSLELSPNQKRELIFQSTFTSPGWFDLNRYNLFYNYVNLMTFIKYGSRFRILTSFSSHAEESDLLEKHFGGSSYIQIKPVSLN
jgi:hypothetical protein